MNKLEQAIAELRSVLKDGRLCTDDDTLTAETENSIGIERSLHAIAYASTRQEVEFIVSVANRYGIPLYPVSRGKNLGYGEKAPLSDGHIMVDLGRMNRIRHFDGIHGKVIIEPGVTQAQLFDFLKDKPFCMDTTGAGIDASVIGNTLEGGFGHTPIGNHRKEITGTEIVLGNGTVLEAGTFPALGPDLNGLFIQSNFGIVTAMEIPLMHRPERYESFLMSVMEDEGLEELVDTLSTLRANGTLVSLVHVANATRSLISTRKCPSEYENRLIHCEDARRLMSSAVARVGYWSAIGGVYGPSRQVAAKKRDVAKALSGKATVRFFDDSKIERISRLLNGFVGRSLGLQRKLGPGLTSLQYLHGLGRGVPSNEALENIAWRVKNKEDMGLIWFAPTFKATGTQARKAAQAAETLFEAHGFEFPMTMTLVEPDKIIGILSISFNKNRREEKLRAHRLYDALHNTFEGEGIHTYRTSILGMERIHYHQLGKDETLKRLKALFDPNNIIAPGRYGLRLHNRHKDKEEVHTACQAG